MNGVTCPRVLCVVLAVVLGTGKAFGQEPSVVRLTDFPNMELAPAWSPDGTKLAIEVSNGSSSLLQVIPETGGWGTPLMVPDMSLNGYPSWSPDGTQIVFQRLDVAIDLWIISASGGVPVRLTTGGNDREPAWSPDGARIAYQSGGASTAIKVVPAIGGASTQIACCNDYAPAWSPDGKWIAFHAQDDIFVMPDTGGTATQITFDSEANRYPAWSPDGANIAFTSSRAGNEDIWMIPSSGGTANQLTFDPASDRWPSWNPDGVRIAFTSDRGGTYDIWVMSLSPTAVIATTWGNLKGRYREGEGRP